MNITRQTKELIEARLGEMLDRFVSRPSRIRECKCMDGAGRPKRLYSSEVDAHFVAEQRMAECHCNLYVYQCPDCDGWHLTKNVHPW